MHMKLITWTKRLVLTCTILALLASNVLTLTSTAFNAALSGLITGALGVRTVTQSMTSRLEARDRKISRQQAVAKQRKRAARRFGARLTARTKRVAAKSIAAIPAESIPFIGVAVLIADTGYELYAACETMRDLDRLYAELGVTNGDDQDAVRTVCQPDLPDADAVWQDVLGKVDQWWNYVLEPV
jgi:hypothetical protein